MLSSQSTITTSSMQSYSSNLVRALDFANLQDHTKKEPYLIDFCNPVDVESECLKYLSDARDLPLGQESQLTLLLNNLKLKDIQMAFIKLITIVGGAATTAFLPMPSTKAKLVKDFLCLIYYHKSINHQQNIHYLNILMTSFSTSSKYSHHEYFILHQKIHTMNILQSLISNSLLLAPCIVRTFEKTLTVVDIIKFTEEDEMKYLIVEHSSGKYF
jgi:hypothetical protein